MSKTRTRLALIIVLIVIAVVGIVVLPRWWEYHKYEKKARMLREKCEELQTGMTRDDVIAIMGEPGHTMEREFRGRMEETLIFASPHLASENTCCIIDKARGVVVKIICGEGYRLTELRQKCEKLEIGMTREQVVEIMGMPDHKEEFKDISGEATQEWYYYISQRHPALVVRCLIDKKSGKLQHAYCD